MTDHFDVFLSHNSHDKPAVIALAKKLKARGLKVWLDAWELRPGQPWQEALEQIIETTQTAAVLVGNDGFGHGKAGRCAVALANLPNMAKRSYPSYCLRVQQTYPNCPFF